MKIITICGSLKFKEEIMKVALDLELQGNCVLCPILPVDSCLKDNFSESDLNMLGKMHFEKIKLSDSIFVVDVGGYIGNSTQKEIEFAKSLNKEIVYYSEYSKQL